MQRLLYFCVWLSRLGYCRGFGIQSPNDYWLVRYVINEHWPYYRYDEMGQNDDWLTRKLGQLYFRLANWRQPAVIISDAYQDYLQAGCRQAVIMDDDGRQTVELARLTVRGKWYERFDALCNRVDDQSVLVVDGLCDNRTAWRRIVADNRITTSFDLYYCGIVMFDKKRSKHNYIINF